jgi:transcriptional regulator with XRE-family HTH domain
MSIIMSISPQQCRAARAMLGWSQDELATAACVARATVADFERENRTPVSNNLAAIRLVFEKEGIQFLPDEDGMGDGIRLRRNKNQS